MDIGRERARPWHDEWPAALVPVSLNPVRCGIPFVVEIGCGCGPRSSFAKAGTNREEVERQMLNLLETEATR